MNTELAQVNNTLTTAAAGETPDLPPRGSLH